MLLAILMVAVLYDAAYRRRTGHRLNLGRSWWDAHTGTAAELPPERPALEARPAVEAKTSAYLPPRRIRALVVGVPREGDRIFVEQGTDEVKGETFYRPLGGEIEFGESAADALRREFMEEIGAEVEVGRQLGCLESRFTYRGAPGHEIVLVHEVWVVEPELTDSVVVREAGGQEATCRWIALEEVRHGDPILYPPGLLELLADAAAAKGGDR